MPPHRLAPIASRGEPLHREIICNFPRCTKSFTRTPDLIRHHNSIHQLTKLFWCTVIGCRRSDSFSGQKRPFPRKDKLEDHVRKKHKAAKNLSRSPSALAVGPSDLSTFNKASGNESLEAANASTLSQSHGLTDINNLVDFAGVPPMNDLAHVWDFAGIDETTISKGFNEVNDFLGFDPAPENWDVYRFIGSNELGNLDIVSNINEPTQLNELIGTNESANSNNLGPTYMPTEIEPGMPLHENITPMWLIDNQATNANNSDNFDSFAGLEGLPDETMFPGPGDFANSDGWNNFGGQPDLGEFDFVDFTNM